jgi:beta-galactosidase
MSNWTRRDLLKAGAAGPLMPPLGGAAAGPQAKEPLSLKSRERLLLDFGWRFSLGHANDPARDFGFGRGSAFAKSGQFCRPSRADFDDSKWRAIDLPHDWAVELPFVEDRQMNEHGAKPLGRTYPETSIGWYRRAFEIPASAAGRRFSLEFDGVFRDAIVSLNGHFIGRNLSGYAPFRFDITDFLTYGGKNALALRVDATEYEGWFYEGAGIYRHVWLVETGPLHVAQWGTFVTSEVRAGTAAVAIRTEVENDGDREAACQVVSTVLDPAGKTVATARSLPVAIGPAAKREIRQQVTVANPALWSIEEPRLYRVLTTIVSGGAQVDRYETPFGIRTIRFDAGKGFFLNGKPVKVKGTCNHQDHAGVGSALPDRLQYFRIEKLKEMGSNAYRTSHNPPTPELLDACDRLGMLVMDETRTMSATPEALGELEKLIRRDRNHPSVIWWSIGNEEPEQGTERGARIATTMKRLVRRLDPTRPVTEAMNNSWGKGLSAVVDIQGFNYNNKLIDEFHQKFPKQPTIGTETASTVCTRGIYENDKDKGYVSAYDRNFPRWACTAEEWWKLYDERPFLQGGFAWTGFDYRGEPTPYAWPCISSHFGIMDVCGFPKDNFYYYQAWWSGRPVLHLFPHWNWAGKEGQEIEVWCHTNLERVELFLNGRSLGTRDVAKNSHAAWMVKYEPGRLEVHGTKDGKPLVAARETTGAPARLVLRPDRSRLFADGEDVSVVEVRVVDAQGRIVPTADNEIEFRLTGGGRIIGVGNGDPSSHEPDKAERRRAFSGLAMAIVQAPKQAGELRLEAVSPGLEPASVPIRCEQAPLRPAVPQV